ncbi:putative cross-wall-targeting lipoprotein signal domain-containing proteiin [Streptococcus catagoni]
MFQSKRERFGLRKSKINKSLCGVTLGTFLTVSLSSFKYDCLC